MFLGGDLLPLLLEGLVGFWRGSHTPSPIQGSYSLGSGPSPSGSSSSRNARRHPEESENVAALAGAR